MLSQFLTESAHLEILKMCNLQVTTSKKMSVTKIIRFHRRGFCADAEFWGRGHENHASCPDLWSLRSLSCPDLRYNDHQFKSTCTRLSFWDRFENKQFHCGSIWCLGATKIGFRFLGGRPGWKESADRKRVPFQDGNFEASECCRICQDYYPETKAWSIQSGHRSCNCTGCFFNSAEFVKCWPVSNWFQKNVRVPDWPPLWSETA